ncbi:Ras-related protein Rab-37 [Geodia barretti]|uniref:Ras-related protein Rab-37 n=1 Tax=Geodia barretti TaxID=519541 RepID=A0AA35W5T7_GEOBA|nr:Ras-related protein Rab-37 [Geodia barretti]
MSAGRESAPPADKVVLVGNPGVGKSTIYQYFKTGRFAPEDQLSHRDKAEHTKKWNVSGVERSMTLYDTAGVERHTQTMLPTYFRRAKAIMLVYSIDNMESFGDIGSNWLDNSLNSANSARVVLVGNKVDLEDGQEVGGESKRVISRERAMQYAVMNDIDRSMVFEISAKTGHGVTEMFDAIVKTIDPVVQSQPAVDEKPNQPSCC